MQQWQHIQSSSNSYSEYNRRKFVTKSESTNSPDGFPCMKSFYWFRKFSNSTRSLFKTIRRMVIWVKISIQLLTLGTFCAVSQENVGLVIPWMVGILTFMSLEAVSTVYLNILRDHINGVNIASKSFLARISINSRTIPFYSTLMDSAKLKLWVDIRFPSRLLQQLHCQ